MISRWPGCCCAGCSVAVPLVFAVVTLTFFVIRLAPGDPAFILAGEAPTPEFLAQIRAEYGLDKPVWQQFLTFLAQALHRRFRHLDLRAAPGVHASSWSASRRPR